MNHSDEACVRRPTNVPAKTPPKVKSPSAPAVPTTSPPIKRFESIANGEAGRRCGHRQSAAGQPEGVPRDAGHRPLDDGDTGRHGPIKSVSIKRRRLISALALKTRRYAICVHGPDVIAVFDKRYMLDGLLAWPELRPTDEDWFGDFENLLRDLSAGPTLNEADDELHDRLAINASALGGLKADPPDDAVAARHSRLYQDSIVFEGFHNRGREVPARRADRVDTQFAQAPTVPGEAGGVRHLMELARTRGRDRWPSGRRAATWMTTAGWCGS